MDSDAIGDRALRVAIAPTQAQDNPRKTIHIAKNASEDTSGIALIFAINGEPNGSPWVWKKGIVRKIPIMIPPKKRLKGLVMLSLVSTLTLLNLETAVGRKKDP